jgi:hypothetical protein
MGLSLNADSMTGPGMATGFPVRFARCRCVDYHGAEIPFRHTFGILTARSISRHTFSGLRGSSFADTLAGYSEYSVGRQFLQPDALLPGKKFPGFRKAWTRQTAALQKVSSAGRLPDRKFHGPRASQSDAQAPGSRTATKIAPIQTV